MPATSFSSCLEMRDARCPRRIIELARLCLCQRDELLKRFGGDLGVRHQDDRRGRQQADGSILQRVIRHILPKARFTAIDVRHHQGVAIGGRLCDRIHADDTASAWSIVDDERLAESLADIGSRIRARLSVPRPTPNGTTSRMGRVG